MPLYSYLCPTGHVIEEVRPVDGRNLPAQCTSHGFPAPRHYTVPQMIMRPWGYSLRPGDKGYWSMETSQGIKPGASSAPFAREEERLKTPLKFAED